MQLATGEAARSQGLPGCSETGVDRGDRGVEGGSYKEGEVAGSGLFFLGQMTPVTPVHPCPDLTSYSYYLLLYYMIL